MNQLLSRACTDRFACYTAVGSLSTGWVPYVTLHSTNDFQFFPVPF